MLWMQLILLFAVHGFVVDNDWETKKTYLEHEIKMFQTDQQRAIVFAVFYP